MSNLRNYNSGNFSWFILVGQGLERVNDGGSLSFRGYTDHANALGRGPGTYTQYVTSKDGNGKDRGKFFTFDESQRRFKVREGEQDIYQITQYDFLKNSPDCEGSPNGTYVEQDGIRVQIGIMFRELNTNKDAEVALEAESRRAEATASALTVDEPTLQELAAFIGVYGPVDKTMRLHVFEWANKRPVDYLTLLKSGDRSLRALVRKGVAEGILTQKGDLIYWSNTLMGANENDALGLLMRDPQMLAALQKKVNLDVPVAVVPTPFGKQPQKNKGGRPPGSKNKPSAPVPQS